MVIVMTNIPRRKIYETLLIFEDGMIEMNILLYNPENFVKYSDAFNKDGYSKIRDSYTEIKALLVMFLENKKFHTDKEFEDELKKMIGNINEIEEVLLSNPNLPKNFKSTIKEMNLKLDEVKLIKSFEVCGELYNIFDKFNHHIPKILEIRRDHMK